MKIYLPLGLFLLIAFPFTTSIGGSSPSVPIGSDNVLIHYWNFNDVPHLLDPVVSLNPASISTTPSPLVLPNELTNSTGQNFNGLNARNSDVAGAHLRLNNPIGASLIFSVSTTGYENVVLKYETRRSGSGAGIQKISYTINGIDYLPKQDVVVLDADPSVVTLDFSALPQVNNNPDFAVRFDFEQGAGGTVGNNRFDNVTVEGNAVPGPDNILLISPEQNATDVQVTPVFEWSAPLSGIAENYHLQIDDDADFSSPILDQNYIIDTEFSLTTSLDEGVTYYWRVKVNAPAGSWDWSVARSFTTRAPELTLIHYWNFDNPAGFTLPELSLNGGFLVSNLVGSGQWLADNSNQGFFGENARNGSSIGSHLRFNNPIGSSLIYTLPTTGFEKIILKYETRRSGSGAGTQKISYTINGTDFFPFRTISVPDGNPVLITIDFSSINEVNNNSAFALRFDFEQGGGGVVGNNRFDNLTLEGNVFTSGGSILLNSPAQAATGISFTPLLSWIDVSGTPDYDVQVATTNDFLAPVINVQGVTSPSFQIPDDLMPATTYFWRVKHSALNDYSSISSFTTISALPDQVALLFPVSTETGVSLKPTFQWQAAGAATDYQLQVSTVSDFSSLITDITGIAALNQKNSAQLLENATYYWRVRGKNAGGFGEWSEIRSFTCTTHYTGFDIRLNEIIASNSAINVDEDGDYSDWIEILNMGNVAVDLTGFGLSDNENSPYKWIFPSRIIQPGEFMLVWASGKNRGGASIHTNFSISADGEEIVLTSPEDIRIDKFLPTPMSSNIAYARLPDGTGSWASTTSPTPGSTNSAGSIQLTEQVNFSHTAGFYAAPFELTLTSTDPTISIIYTLDGSDPDPANLNGKTYTYKNKYPLAPGEAFGELLTNTYMSYTYTTPISVYDRSAEPDKLTGISSAIYANEFYMPLTPVQKATVVKARVVDQDMNKGPIETRTFFIREQNSYNLPIVSISVREDLFFGYENGIYVPGNDFDQWRLSNMEAESSTLGPANYARDVEYPVNFEFFENTTFSRVLNQQVGAKIAGGTSVASAEKSLRLFARSEYGNATMSYPVFPDKQDLQYKRITLRNSGNDNRMTMFRDGAIQESVKHLNFGTQAYRPSIVFINGEYWGIHNTMEHLDKNYLAARYGVDPENVDLLENESVKEGDNLHYYSMIDYIKTNGVSATENFNYIKTQMDIDNFIDYQIAEIFVANVDWPGNNVINWRNKASYREDVPSGQDGRWRWLMKDTDFGLGLGTSYHHNTLAFAAKPGGTEWPNPDWSTFLFRSLLTNDTFKHQFINRFSDLLNTTFLPERMSSVIERLKTELIVEMPNHIARWKGPASMAEWNSYVGVMNEFVLYRPFHQRNHIQEFFNLPEKDSLTLNVSDADYGYVRLNTIDITESTVGIPANPYPWTGIYFEDIPVNIKAVAKPGYQFVGWLEADSLASNEIQIELKEKTLLTAIFAKASDRVLRSGPLNKAKSVAVNPTFVWLASNAQSVDLQISVSPDFTNLILDQTNIISNRFAPDIQLDYLTNYFWRIRKSGEEEWTEAWSFVTTPRPVELVSPADGAQKVALKPDLKWKKVDYADNYILQLSEDPDFDSLILNETTEDSMFVMSNSLHYKTKYYWRIKANSPAIESTWSESWSFVTTPQQVVLSSPADGVRNVALNPKFTWKKIKDTDFYALQISRDADFNTLIVDKNDIADSTFTVSSNLMSYSTKYYWRVKATNSLGGNEWSDVRTFNTKLLSPALTLTTASSNSSNVVDVVKWDAITPGSKYALQISKTIDFQDTVISITDIKDLEFILSELLGSTYYIRIKAFDDSDESDWSETLVYQLPDLTPIELNAPLNQAIGIRLNPAFSWKQKNSGDRYVFQLSKNESFTNLILNTEVDNPEFTLSDSLDNLTIYFWRVSVSNASSRVWSQTWSFTTKENKITGLEQGATSVSIFPNPTHGELNIRNLKDKDIYQLEVHDMLGKQIEKLFVHPQQEAILLDMSNYPKGMYLVVLKGKSDFRIATKIIVN